MKPLHGGNLSGWRDWWAWVIRTAQTEADKVRAFVEAAARFNEALAELPATRRQLEALEVRAAAFDGDARKVLEAGIRSVRAELEELEQNGVGLLARVREFLDYSNRAKAGGDELGFVVAGWVALGVGAGAVAGGAALTWWLTRNDGTKAKANALGRVADLIEGGKVTAAEAANLLRAAGIGVGGMAQAALWIGLGVLALAMWPRVRRHARRLTRRVA